MNRSFFNPAAKIALKTASQKKNSACFFYKFFA
ncbi:MAG: cyclic lactone autoinducer peptide [Tannerella sp.]|nr:cyclic lactone autoinducer peptide [Tannerella sp.]